MRAVILQGCVVLAVAGVGLAPTAGTASGQERTTLIERAAATHDLSVSDVRELLSEDDTVFIDPTGRIGFLEPAISPAATPPPVTAAAAPYPLGSTFTLHSKPGSQRTIYLDFDGHNVAGTGWDSTPGTPSNTNIGPYDADGNTASFSDVEKENIQTIWQEVAEDYAPFDVDVTTQDPGYAGINRANSADQVFGTRALITSDNAWRTAFGGSGIAYLDVFDITGSDHDRYQPALVFTGGVAGVPHWIAQTTSHEVGHNLSLDHDGGGGDGEYYYGVSNGLFAPIMGASFENPMSQWSRGEYAGASNTEDDLALMTSSGISYRTDEAGQTTGAASYLSTLPAGRGFIASTNDEDWFKVTCSAGASLQASVTVAPRGANLDAALTVRSGAGQVAAAADTTTRVNDLVATGLGATVSYAVPTAGTYYLTVDGVGHGAWASGGYSGYGSLGEYTLTQSGCSPSAPPAATAPGTPTALTATPNDTNRSVQLTWSPPVSDGGSGVTSYRVRVDGGAFVDVGTATAYTVNGLSRAAHSFEVAAVNIVGQGASAGTSATIRSLPGAPPSVSASAATGSVTVDWERPGDALSSAPISGYRITLLQSGIAQQNTDVAAGVRSHTFSSLPASTSYTVRVRALVGAEEAAAADSGAVRTPDPVVAPSRPSITGAASGPSGGTLTAKVIWLAPASDGGSAVTAYVVRATQVGSGTTRTSGTLASTKRAHTMKLPAGKWRFTVLARNAIGDSPWSARSAAVRPR